MVGDRVHLLELSHVNVTEACDFAFGLCLFPRRCDVGLGGELIGTKDGATWSRTNSGLFQKTACGRAELAALGSVGALGEGRLELKAEAAGGGS